MTMQRAAVATTQATVDSGSHGRESVDAATKGPIVPVSYVKIIKPLLEDKCAECHKDEIKGGFDVSTIASMIKGGKKAGPGIIPGEPDKSPVVAYCIGTMKPRMPKGEDALTAEQIALLRNWIAGGAKDDSNTKVADTAPAASALLPNNARASSRGREPAVPASPAVPAPVAFPAPTVSPNRVSRAAATFKLSAPIGIPKFSSLPLNRLRGSRRLHPSKESSCCPAIPTTQAIVFNPIDNFILAKYPATQPVAMAQATTQATSQASTQPRHSIHPISLFATIPRSSAGFISTSSARFQPPKKPKLSSRARMVTSARNSSTRSSPALAITRPTGSPFWEDALCSNGQHQGGVGTHGNYRQWIFDSYNANKPYDTFVQELLDPSMPGHPQRYVLNQDHMRTIQSSADTAQVFLGTAIKCASCHSHFLNDEWPQARAVAFAGFFSDKDMELIRCERKTGNFVATHFMFDLPAAPTSAPSDPNARLKEVAQLVTDPTNPRFARTMVNRLWKRYMGLGFFEPADDYREDTPPSHPELLNWLADDFIRHGFDVKRTARMILTSRTYELRYDPMVEDHFDVAKPKDPRYFRSPALRRLTAEQMLDSITVATEQKLPERRAYQDDNSTPLTRSLGKPAARNEVSTARPDDTAVVQSLELLNGQEFHDRIYKGKLIDSLSIDPKTDELIDQMYLSTLSRTPTAKEKEVAIKFIDSAPATQPASTQPVEVVWFDDALPTKAPSPPAIGESLESAGPAGFYKVERRLIPRMKPSSGAISAFIHGREISMSILPQDVVFVYVYLDPANPPKEIMLQLHDGKDWMRAAWGESVIEFKPKVTGLWTVTEDWRNGSAWKSRWQSSASPKPPSSTASASTNSPARSIGIS